MIFLPIAVFRFVKKIETLRGPRILNEPREWAVKMERKKFTYWQDDDMWLGYFEEYPDYMTQGETLEALKENLRDVYSELSGGNIPHVRKSDLLDVA